MRLARGRPPAASQLSLWGRRDEVAGRHYQALGQGAVLHHGAVQHAKYLVADLQAGHAGAHLLDNARHVEARHGGKRRGHGLLVVALAHEGVQGVEAGGFHAQQHVALAHGGQVEVADLKFINPAKFGVEGGFSLRGHKVGK